MKYLYPFSTTTVLAAALLLAGCGHKEGSHKTETLPAADVRTAPVELRVHPRAQWLPGTVNPADQAVIATKLMATVEEVDVDIGQKVSRGDMLVRLKALEVEA